MFDFPVFRVFDVQRWWHHKVSIFFPGISSSMNFDEEDDDEDEVSSSSSQLNSNTRPGSATSKKSSKVRQTGHVGSHVSACV